MYKRCPRCGIRHRDIRIMRRCAYQVLNELAYHHLVDSVNERTAELERLHSEMETYIASRLA